MTTLKRPAYYRTILIYTVEGVTREADTRYTYFSTERAAERDNRANVRLYGSASAWIEYKRGDNWSRG